jgi:hypothetical protein
MRKPLSKSQIVCIALLWVALCAYILANTKQIDGPTVVSLVISGALVFIPLAKAIKKR